MKYLYRTLIAMTFMFVLATGVAFAQDTDRPTPPRAQTQQDRAIDVQERRAEFQTQQQERRAEFVEHVQTYRNRVQAQIYRRFEAGIVRMEILIARTESRIEKFEDRGIDTITAVEHLTEAQEAVDEAKVSFAAFKDSIENADTEEDITDLRAQARIIADELIENLKDAKQALLETLFALRDAIREHTQETEEDSSEE